MSWRSGTLVCLVFVICFPFIFVFLSFFCFFHLEQKQKTIVKKPQTQTMKHWQNKKTKETTIGGGVGTEQTRKSTNTKNRNDKTKRKEKKEKPSWGNATAWTDAKCHDVTARFSIFVVFGFLFSFSVCFFFFHIFLVLVHFQTNQTW